MTNIIKLLISEELDNQNPNSGSAPQALDTGACSQSRNPCFALKCGNTNN